MGHLLASFCALYSLLLIPNWSLAVTRLVTRKEQKIPPYEAYFRNQHIEESQYTKFWQIVIPCRFDTKSWVTSRATFGVESARYYDLPKFGILGLLDALILKKIPHRVWFFLLLLTSYKPCNRQVPFRCQPLQKYICGQVQSCWFFSIMAFYLAIQVS